jgi:hypothetical protein
MTAVTLRPRTATEIVDAAARLLAQHYLTLVTIAVVVQLPIAALEIFIGPQTLEPGGATYNGLLSFLVRIAGGLALNVADGAIILVISDVYLGGSANAASALRRTWPRLATLIAAGIMAGIATGLAALLLILPGIYVATRLATLPAVVMCEHDDSTLSYSRAWELGKDEVGRIFVPMLIAWVIYFSAVIGIAFGASLLGKSVPVLQASGVTMVLLLLAPILVHPLVAVTSVLVYYDLRVRKEAFDLEIMAKEIGVAVPQY